MPKTTVVFVHGFVSNPNCWNPFFTLLNQDLELIADNFRFARYQYPTSFLQLDISKRIPTIKECGNSLGTFLETRFPEGELMLVGHSMGGLVIQSYLAEKLRHSLGKELARIRSVILFATPNRGSTMLNTVRGIFNFFRTNPQEQQLQVLDESIADLNETIVRCLLGAKSVDRDSCPIPFRVFWGQEDNVVPEASARGPFAEASALPGDHSGILNCAPDDPNDQRYLSLKDALIHPVGHPSIYEIDRFEVSLAIAPCSPDSPVVLHDLDTPLTIYAGNVATRSVSVEFAQQNRCATPYEQIYQSKSGHVQSLGATPPNQVRPEIETQNRTTGTIYTYLFKPGRKCKFKQQLKIYNGFGEGQRSWHNHMNENARYKLFRLTLDLKAYREAGFALAPEPALFFLPENVPDHQLCASLNFDAPIPPLSADPWLRAWELPDVYGGVINLTWDLQPPSPLSSS